MKMIVSVHHSIVAFNDGNVEAVMAVYRYKDGKITSLETGATQYQNRMSNIISFAMVEQMTLKARKFYDLVLDQIGLKRITTVEDRYIGYGHLDNTQDIKFYVTKPYNKQDATIGNGTMIALAAQNKDAVNNS